MDCYTAEHEAAVIEHIVIVCIFAQKAFQDVEHTRVLRPVALNAAYVETLAQNPAQPTL